MCGERSGWIKAIGLIGLGVVFGVAVPGQEASGAKQKKVPPPRIGYVNIAKVLLDFRWANQEGAKITKRREAFIEQTTQKREAVTKLEKELGETNAGDARRTLKGKIEALEAEIKQIDVEAKKELTEASNAALRKVYEQVRTVTRELAEERGLDVIEAFPAATKREDETNPQIAQLMLQTPALMPFYLRPELDVTQEVVDRLNKKYPKDE